MEDKNAILRKMLKSQTAIGGIQNLVHEVTYGNYNYGGMADIQ